MSCMVEIDGRETDLAAFAANAGVPLETLRERVRRRVAPYTSADLLTDGRKTTARARGQKTRDHVTRAAVVALRETGASMRTIAATLSTGGRRISKARVGQILASEGYSGKSSPKVSGSS